MFAHVKACDHVRHAGLQLVACRVVDEAIKHQYTVPLKSFTHLRRDAFKVARIKTRDHLLLLGGSRPADWALAPRRLI